MFGREADGVVGAEGAFGGGLGRERSRVGRSNSGRGAGAWLETRSFRRSRTRSATTPSNELECVFFSATPTFGSTSMMALALTSSSLASSLIRILFVRVKTPVLLRRFPSYITTFPRLDLGSNQTQPQTLHPPAQIALRRAWLLDRLLHRQFQRWPSRRRLQPRRTSRPPWRIRL